MAIRKFGAPATSHVKGIIAEDVQEVLIKASEKLSQTEKDKLNEKEHDSNKDERKEDK